MNSVPLYLSKFNYPLMELKDVWVLERSAYHEQGVIKHFRTSICEVEYQVVSVCGIAVLGGSLILNI